MAFTLHLAMPWIIEQKSGLLFKIDQSGKIGTFAHTEHIDAHSFELCQAAVTQARHEFKAMRQIHCHRFGTWNSDLRRSLCERVTEILNEEEYVLTQAVWLSEVSV